MPQMTRWEEIIKLGSEINEMEGGGVGGGKSVKQRLGSLRKLASLMNPSHLLKDRERFAKLVKFEIKGGVLQHILRKSREP